MNLDFKEGTTLLVNKPKTWTSFDVVNKIRYGLKRALNTKKIKVGHAGTLDPLATGLLIICTGKSTKKLAGFQGLDKEYTGIITVGATRPSYDLETEIDATFPTDHISATLIEEARITFLGEQDQLPPIFSAIKVDGQPIYRKARQGKDVEVKSRRIIIHDFEITQVELPDIHFRVICSKGTYIRSLAYDFGKALNSGAYLKELCRTKIGTYKLDNAWELEKLIKYIESTHSDSGNDEVNK